jgi:hypothetical protein
MTKTQQYWAQRQEHKIEDLEHDWKELSSLCSGEEEDKFTVLIPVCHKPPKIRLLKLFFKGGCSGRREVELRSEVSIGQLEQSLGKELDKQKAVYKKCRSEDFCTANCLNYSKEANDCFNPHQRNPESVSKEKCENCCRFEFRWDYEDEIVKRPDR